MDDGSSDSSLALAQVFVSDRVRVISQANRGVSAARNAGAAMANGSWLLFLDADDRLRPNTLIQMLQVISENLEQDCFHFGVARIHSKGVEEKLPGRSGYFSKLAGSFLLRREVFEKVGGYDERLRFSENTELFYRLNQEGIRSKVISWISVEYHESQGGGSKNLQNTLEGLELILDKHRSTLSTHVKHLYHQTLGVIYLRFRQFGPARSNFLQALRYKPWKPATLARWILTFFPALAKKVYSPEVRNV